MDLSLLVRFFSQGAALGLTAAATPGSLQTLLISETLLGGMQARGARHAGAVDHRCADHHCGAVRVAARAADRGAGAEC